MSEALGIKSLCQDLGWNLQVRVHTDSSAAMGVTKRSGCGKIRHLQTQYLWIQELVVQRCIIIYKVDGKKNSSDLLTKYLDGNSISRYLSSMGMIDKGGRASIAPFAQICSIGRR